MVVMKKYCNKFTLVEILAVVALIGILTAIGFGAYTYAMNSAKESSTKALIKRLEAALENHRTKYGYYPASKGDYQAIKVAYNEKKYKVPNPDDPANPKEIELGYVITFDDTKPSTVEATKQVGDQMKDFWRVIEAESLMKSVRDEQLQDGWGGTIYYKYPGTINKTGFDLVSAGADGKFGNDTVTDRSKPAPERTGYYPSATATEKDCDDITNF